MQQWRKWLAAGALVLALVFAGLWAHGQWRRPGSLSLAIPIAPSRVVHLSIWKPIKDNTSFIANGQLAHEIDRPLTVVAWYSNTAAVTMTRLLQVRLPNWPLLVMAGGCAFIAARTRPKGRNEPSRRQ